MRKLHIGSMIVFLMLFTASFASPCGPAKLTFPVSTTTGTLYFISDSSTGTVTSDSTATIKIDQETLPVTTGEPTNFFYGTLTMDPGTPLTTLNIKFAAIREGDSFFRITGTDGAGTFVQATAIITCPSAQTSVTPVPGPPTEEVSVELTGSIIDSSTTPTATYRFQGALH